MNYSGMKVLIMGLGINGGGLESARYLAQHGADITVTDLRDEKILAPSLEKLQNLSAIRYVLGRHEMADFEKADMVIKNPGVKPDSPFLKASQRIETDISLFLASNPARLTAVTGSKGKSSTASALHWVLSKAHKQKIFSGKALLGGNITISPLSFLEELDPNDDVVLELSSWQLGDLKARVKKDGTALLKPRCAVITSILPDHLDRYGTMESYVADKRIIYQGQDKDDVTIAGDDQWGKSFFAESNARHLVYSEKELPDGIFGAWLTDKGSGFARFGDNKTVEIVPSTLKVPGFHQKKNLLAAGLSLFDLGIPADFIRENLGDFPGIEHRLEFFYEKNGIRFYNDTTATIPEASARAVLAFEKAPILVTGGTDKNLDFSPFVDVANKAKAIILLAGTGSEKLKILLDKKNISYKGPFDNLDNAVKESLSFAKEGDIVVLSPGCTSFGMFINEFDRGAKWKESVKRLA